ncbi:alpha-amylase [Ruminococcus sp. AF41-9]|nr:alpha-amylase [Ruminococcus sp. AF41-9]
MSWYNEAIFYHIYPLGLTGAPKTNDYGAPVSRLNTLLPWVDHIKEIGCTALYIGPLFESVGHGYETTDYKKLDSRLGTNEDLKNFVAACHEKGIKVIFDGVFNHTGRDFFAFKDIQQNREHSRYLNWYCNVNFGGNNEYNDGFSYENWGGYNLLVKLNQRNPEVQNYICDVIRFWVSEFDVDGIRLDAADVLDFDFMRALRRTAAEVKKDFWLMGEVIHGDYSRWVNGETLHSVTNYALHKALYSGHNDHNYFEIAHTVKYLQNMGNLDLYNFVDNHDVERIYTKLSNKAHFAPVHVLLYTLPGVPSIYYGSEFGIEGKKEKFSDDSLRPALNLEDYADAVQKNPCTALIAALGKVRQHTPALSYGSYAELQLTNRQFAFARDLDGVRVIVTVNNDDNAAGMSLQAGNCAEYIGTLTGQKVSVQGGRINVTVAANSGEIWVPAGEMPDDTPVKVTATESEKAQTVEKAAEVSAQTEQSETPVQEANLAAEETAAARADEIQPEKTTDAAEPSTKAEENTSSETEKTPAEPAKAVIPDPNKAPEDMTVEELQQAILAKMANNGPVTDQMKKTVYDNIWHDSLVNWLKSFR